MIEIFYLPFMQKAFVSGLALAALLAFLGVFVVARRMSFFGDGIAHASLAGVAIGLLASFNPFLSALIVGTLMGAFIYFLEKKTKIATDAVIGLIFTTSLALGVILLSFRRGYQPELISFLFGNILTLSSLDVRVILFFSIAIIALVAAMLRPFALTVFDRSTAWLRGIPVSLMEFLFYVILSFSVILGVKLLGIILVSALLIIPPITGRLLAKSLKTLILYSLIVGEVAVFLGLLLSYYMDLPSGATIILVSSGLFFAVLLAKGVLSFKKS